MSSITFEPPIAGSAHSLYESPLTQRYASKEMGAIWSPAMKFGTWRRLWLALATAQKELGIDISDEQIAQMAANLELNEEEARTETDQSLPSTVVRIGSSGGFAALNMARVLPNATILTIEHRAERIARHQRTLAPGVPGRSGDERQARGDRARDCRRAE